MRENDNGFTLLELVIAIFIVGIGLSIVLPVFISARDHAALETSAWQIVSDLRTQQMSAQFKQVYQEVRFLPYSNTYYFYDGSNGSFTPKTIASPIAFYEGIVHLPSSTVRFNPLGNINEGGQIIIQNPEGAMRNAVLYLQYGDIRMAYSPVIN